MLKRQTKNQNDTVKKTKRRRKLNWPFIFNFLVIITLCIMLVGGGFGFFYVSKKIEEAPKLNVNDFNSTQSTSIYDSENNLIMDIGKELRENVTYDQLPQCLIDAFVSIEDSRFFTHNGFDLPRFAKAMIVNLKNRDFSQGGSTFTMQMVKNTYFLKEGSGGAAKSIERKVQEIFLAMSADKKLSKKQIFQNYINKINFGGPARGVQKASKYYFGKGVEDIGISEAALLAGVINLPNYYNPYYNLEAATLRRNEVINMMEYHGYITELDAQLAKAIKVEDILVGEKEVGSIIPYQAYVDRVIVEVEELTGKNPYETPMKIYTAMDRYAQGVVEAAQNGKYSSVKVNAHKYLDSALVAMNHNSEIVVIGGGKNYSGQRMFNKATDMKKQNGSTMKLILSYPLAFEYLGMTTGSYLADTPIVYQGTGTKINNFDGKYRGIIPVSAALIESRNVPAVDLLTKVTNLVGPEKVIEYMNAIGFDYVTDKTYSIMNAIGGGDFSTSPLQLAGAYNVLMNGGRYTKPHTILKIEYYDGTAPFTPSYTPVQAISEQAVYLTASILERAVATCATGNYCLLKRNHPVYSKSGTTDWGVQASRELRLPVTNGSKDKWLATTTTDYAIAVWIGFDVGIPGANTYYSQSILNKTIDGYLTKVTLDALEKGKPKPKGIEKPAGIGSASFIKGYTTHYQPVAGMPSEYITSGLNKNGSTTLSTFTMPEVGSFDDTGYSINENGNYTITVNVPTYENLEYFHVASYKTTFPYGSKNYSGNRGNHVTWWMGPVRYFTNIKKADGTIVYTSPASDQTSYNIDFTSITGVSENENLSACSYYAFSTLTDYRSNEACRSFTYHTPPVVPTP